MSSSSEAVESDAALAEMEKPLDEWRKKHVNKIVLKEEMCRLALAGIAQTHKVETERLLEEAAAYGKNAAVMGDLAQFSAASRGFTGWFLSFRCPPPPTCCFHGKL
tara:strand:+ start:125 stop:442 length:318 start_codon:yes stop_codon:yes gene_type:complete